MVDRSIWVWAVIMARVNWDSPDWGNGVHYDSHASWLDAEGEEASSDD